MSSQDQVIEIFLRRAENENLTTVDPVPISGVDSLADLDGNIIDVIMIDADGKPFYSRNGVDLNVHNELWSESIFTRKEIQGAFFDIPDLAQYAFLRSGPTFLYAIDVYQPGYAESPRRRLGSLVFLCGLTSVSSLVLDVDNLGVEIFNANGAKLLSNYGVTKETGKIYSHFDNSIRYTGWNLRVSVRNEPPFPWNSPFIFFPLVIISLSALVVFGVFAIVHESVQKPVALLIDELDLRNDKRGTLRVSETGGPEIGRIARHINRLMEYQDSLIDRDLKNTQKVFELKMYVQQAELAALRSQINPHFLYNSLECVRGMAVAFKAKPIENIMVALGRVLRYSIKGRNIVTVSEELKIIQEYFSIIKYRFSDRFQMHMDIAPELTRAKIPKMILQPIFENAVTHGLADKHNGNVWISGRLDSSRLIFTVKDDGCSVTEEKLSELRGILESKSVTVQTESIGLLNTHRHIQNMYGEAFGLAISNYEGKGFLVEINLPFYTDGNIETQSAD
ncbi:MAG: histidine kinase [Clostridiales bacterium]|nr:histidine kinase [Clostridiales bacterium]